MAISLLQSKTGTGTSPTTNITWDKNTTNGSLILIVIGGQSIGTPSATDSQTNSYSVVDTQVASTKTGALLYAANITGGTTPTITITTSGIFVTEVVIQEWSGISAAPLDAHTTATANSTALNSGATGVLAYPNQLVVGWGMAENTSTATVGSGYSNFITTDVATSVSIESKKIMGKDSGQIATMTGGASSPWACGVATFIARDRDKLGSTNLRPAIFSPGLAR